MTPTTSDVLLPRQPRPSHWVRQDRLAGAQAALRVAANAGALSARILDEWQLYLADLASRPADTALPILPDGPGHAWRQEGATLLRRVIDGASFDWRHQPAIPPPSPAWSALCVLAALGNRPEVLARDLDAHRPSFRAITMLLAGAHHGYHGLGLTHAPSGLILDNVWPHRSEPIRTSQSSPLRLDAISVGAGAVAMTICPGKCQAASASGAWQRDLAMDLQRVVDWGASDLVTLLPTAEMLRLGAAEMPALAERMGLRWWHWPIQDGGVPSMAFHEAANLGAWRSLTATLRSGGRVVVHCKGGIGRSGLVAAMLAADTEPNVDLIDLVDRVRAARHGAIETVVQEWFLARYLRPGARLA